VNSEERGMARALVIAVLLWLAGFTVAAILYTVTR
jgi:hypothetical protein